MVQTLVEHHKNMIIPKEYHIDSKQVQDRFKVISKIFESKFQRLASIGEREGEMVEPFKNHFISCAWGRAWTARAEDVTRKK